MRSRGTLLMGVLVLGVLVAMSIPVWGAYGTGSHGHAGPAQMGANRATSLPRSLVRAGGIAPSFRLQDASGNSVRLRELAKRNEAIVLWFGIMPEGRHAQDAVAASERVSSKFASNRSFAFYGVASHTTDISQIQAYSRQHNLTYPVLIDQNGSIARRYGVTTMPTIIVISKDRVVQSVAAGWGGRTESSLESQIQTLLSGKLLVHASSAY